MRTIPLTGVWHLFVQGTNTIYRWKGGFLYTVKRWLRTLFFEIQNDRWNDERICRLSVVFQTHCRWWKFGYMLSCMFLLYYCYMRIPTIILFVERIELHILSMCSAFIRQDVASVCYYLRKIIITFHHHTFCSTYMNMVQNCMRIHSMLFVKKSKVIHISRYALKSNACHAFYGCCALAHRPSCTFHNKFMRTHTPAIHKTDICNHI